ncbi:hypothetical protein M501DRAFT_994834 [Patellaria atrata CBS 101060]|uniref:RSE1/DDB1/CPSF1 first beta-propeller domain-containing protein n=1 Tax=Patellaria atrata CBS 101060 TaxID=1346257 RepID=A0A9P4SIX5_9PEZI|nr:hypothetical protein M501DRAFT_994834 [Patellaria atrata CBS 101060]
MATTSNMFMYSLTLQPPSSSTITILGQFAGTKEQQLLSATGSILKLFRLDPSSGKITTILTHNVFGIIRSISPFRIAGSTKACPTARRSACYSRCIP